MAPPGDDHDVAGPRLLDRPLDRAAAVELDLVRLPAGGDLLDDRLRILVPRLVATDPAWAAFADETGCLDVWPDPFASILSGMSGASVVETWRGVLAS
ncbi:MAG TPA: hypothetical protein VNJ54_01225, partial [Plantibacter sp.]|nr:hypothetical protein [Plantibacter sp.]